MPVSHDLCTVERPEDTVNWLRWQPWKCLQYPVIRTGGYRDCPGCIIVCARLPYIELGEINVTQLSR